MSSITELKQKIKDARTKAYSLKTKKAKDKQFLIIRELTRLLNEALLEAIEPYLGARHKATVLMNGTDVLAKSEFGTIQLYAINDVKSKSWYDTTCCVSFKEGDVVTFEIMHPHATDGQLHWIAGKIEGGHFDQQKYDELCKRDDLAFFKKPDGSRSGLFK